jgi:Mn-dependent DtxR family transcriptional regulator
MDQQDFYTFNGYIKRDDSLLTASMEDYVEMIYRLSIEKGYTRIHDLSESLNVQPPSVTKMVQRLSELKLADYEKYGLVSLTAAGKDIGKALLKRHNTVEKLLRLLGVSKSLLEETEKIEHSINEETLRCIYDFLNFIESDSEIKNKFESYKNSIKDEERI